MNSSGKDSFISPILPITPIAVRRFTVAVLSTLRSSLSVVVFAGIVIHTTLLFTLRAEAGEGVPDSSALRYHVDAQAGYQFLIPSGYQLLTLEQHHAAIEGLSKFIGKEAADRAQRYPPSLFLGPEDPKRPNGIPPGMSVEYTDFKETIDPARLSEYKTRVEEGYRRDGTRYADLKLTAIKVNGIDALRFEHELFSPIDNSRSQRIEVAIPCAGRRYDIVFDFHPDQAESVERALSVVLDTFKIERTVFADPQTQSKWTRIALWTGGCFIAGIILSLLLKMLSGISEKEPEESGG